MKVHQIVLSILENPREVFLLEGSAKFFEQHLLGSPIRLDQNLGIQQSSHTDILFPRPTLQHIPSCSKRLATQTLFQVSEGRLPNRALRKSEKYLTLRTLANNEYKRSRHPCLAKSAILNWQRLRNLKPPSSFKRQKISPRTPMNSPFAMTFLSQKISYDAF